MDAPPAVCSLGGLNLRIVWRANRARASAPISAGTSDHSLHRRAVHWRASGQQRTDSGSNAHKSGATVFQPSVEQDVAALYKTGAIRNVRIFAQPEGDGV